MRILSWLVLFFLYSNNLKSENAANIAFNRNVLITTDTGGNCSGFTIETGLVLTAKHCVEDAKEVRVNDILVDEIIVSQDRDVAKLKVKTKNFKRIAFTKSLAIGDKVRMVGNPIGKVGWSFHGEISFLSQDGMVHTSFIGVPGTSGAGVITDQGKFCGIHTGYYYYTDPTGLETKMSGIFVPYNLFPELVEEKKSVIIIDLPILPQGN